MSAEIDTSRKDQLFPCNSGRYSIYEFEGKGMHDLQEVDVQQKENAIVKVIAKRGTLPKKTAAVPLYETQPDLKALLT
jgi:hypothetical protein